MRKRRSEKENIELKKLFGVAYDLGITIEEVGDDKLEGSGGLYLEPDLIYVPKDQKTSDLILSIAHELGHAISELRGEVEDEFHDIYEGSYPEELGQFVDEYDREIIRFIEVRAVLHANRLMNKLKIKVSKSRRDIDNLYTMLSLETILEKGILEDDDIDLLYDQCRDYLMVGKTWDKLYERFMLDQ